MSNLLRYTAYRILQSIPLLIGISVVVFALVEAMPGDPINIIVQGQEVDEETLRILEERYGLDQPSWRRYLNFMGISQLLETLGFSAFEGAPTGLLQGDLGTSLHHQRPVSELMMTRLGPTLLLVLSAFAFALVTAIPLGVLSAKRRNKPADHVSRLIALVGVSTPSFWIAIMLIIIFAVELGWLPSGNLILPWRDPSHYGYSGQIELYQQTLRHLLLPMIALGTLQMATIMRLERAEMLDSLQKEYVQLARAYGISEGKILRKHAFRPAQLPIITIIGLNLSTALGGAVLTETVFNINGMGRLVVGAIGQLDYEVILGSTMMFGTLFVIGVILTDLAYAYIDPRISYGDRTR
jgi:peptide/nickel transport system permease protein